MLRSAVVVSSRRCIAKFPQCQQPNFIGIRTSSSSSSSTQQSQTVPRIAVIGGGIAGTLCSLVLKNRGLHPILLDAGKNGLGGRMRHGGIPYLRIQDPRMIPIMDLLEHQAKLITPWNPNYGMLGSSGGGFLPASIVQTSTNTNSNSNSGANSILGLSRAVPEEESKNNDDNTNSKYSLTDGGDFCQFVQGTGPMYIGIPSNADICPQICSFANIENYSNQRVMGASMVLPQGGWKIHGSDENDTGSNDNSNIYDAMVVATHDPSLASQIVQTIIDTELQAGNYKSIESILDGDNGDKDANEQQLSMVLSRLNELSTKLQDVRKFGKRPLYSVRVEYEVPSNNNNNDNDSKLPFDAVSVPGSQIIQYLINESSSKPTFSRNNKNKNTTTTTHVWTAITTSQLADFVLNQNHSSSNTTTTTTTSNSSTSWSEQDQTTHIARVVTEEMNQLLQPYYYTNNKNNNKNNNTSLNPSNVKVKRWGAALSSPGLQLKEDSITLAQWRLAICGDYIGGGGGTTNENTAGSSSSTPWELAALSGLEAGERIASLFATTSSPESPSSP